MSNESKRNNLHFSSKFIFAIRAFFHQLDFIECQTPIRVKQAALEDFIDPLRSEDMYLRTSPELHMKRLLASSFDKIFQIGACFRANEVGTKHREEFTLLEFYLLHKNYNDILFLCQKLLSFLAKKFSIKEAYFNQQWQIISVKKAFELYSDISLEKAISTNVFEEILTIEVEPQLGIDQVTIINDYPAEMAALSKLKDDDKTLAERWEMYINGIEIANCYSELTSPKEQLQRFLKTIEFRKSIGKDNCQIDQEFIACLDDLPECSGIAIGIERLLMSFLDEDDIANVCFF